jgi:transposase-like protein
MLSYDQFPKAHWRHLRTTNVVESPFAAVRLRQSAAKRFTNVERATVIIWRRPPAATQNPPAVATPNSPSRREGVSR